MKLRTVYTLDATIFSLFGEYNRTREKWQLSDKLFERDRHESCE